MEKVQKAAARFATRNYTFETGNTKINMNTLNLKPLAERRAAIKLNLFYKALHSLVEIPMNHLQMSTQYTRNSAAGAYVIPQSNVDSHKYSFYPSTVRLWNDLPYMCKQVGSADSFKNSLDKIVLRAAY